MKIIACKQVSAKQIFQYLRNANHMFLPILSEQVDLTNYANKISRYADVIWAIDGKRIAGMCAYYANEPPSAYLTSISVLPEFQKTGIAHRMLRQAIKSCQARNFMYLDLHVFQQNVQAIALYRQIGFEYLCDDGKKLVMRYKL